MANCSGRQRAFLLCGIYVSKVELEVNGEERGDICYGAWLDIC